MITNPAEIKRSQPVNPHEPTSMQRRALISGAIGATMAALLSSPAQVMAAGTATPNDAFILLLKGVYRPVVRGPSLGLSAVDLDDGTYSTTKVYPVFGLARSSTDDNRQDEAIGNFYVQFNGHLCAYQLPGGAIAMHFNPGGGFTPHPDGRGGVFLEGTFELTVLEATGIYREFRGGHNHMVDKLHQLADGRFNEFCFCIISQYQFP